MTPSGEDDPLLNELSDSDLDFPDLSFEEDTSDSSESRQTSCKTTHTKCGNPIIEPECGPKESALIPQTSNKQIEVLVYIGERRKKVMTLENSSDNLEEIFLDSISNDPKYERYRKRPFVFQIFNDKFGTWVDLNQSHSFIDGDQIRVIFLKKKKSKHKRDELSLERYKRTHSPDSDSITHTEHNVKKVKISQFSYNTFRPTSSTKSVNFCTSTSESMVFSDRNGKREAIGKQLSLIKAEILPPTKGDIYCHTLGLADKNPVSALYELCVKQSWGTPVFSAEIETVFPEPKFLMKVTVNGKVYVPDTPSKKKKLAKSVAAEYCLKQMGIYK